MAGSVSKEALMSNRWKTEAASRVQLEWNEENVEKSKRTGIQIAQARAAEVLNKKRN